MLNNIGVVCSLSATCSVSHLCRPASAIRPVLVHRYQQSGQRSQPPPISTTISFWLRKSVQPFEAFNVMSTGWWWREQHGRLPSNKEVCKILRVNHFIFLMETRWPRFPPPFSLFLMLKFFSRWYRLWELSSLRNLCQRASAASFLLCFLSAN